MLYHVFAEVIYSDQIEAETAEEAIEKFEADCSYAIVGEIECEEED